MLTMFAITSLLHKHILLTLIHVAFFVSPASFLAKHMYTPDSVMSRKVMVRVPFGDTVTL